MNCRRLAGLVGAREVLLLTAEAPAPLDPSVGLSWSLFWSTHPRSSVASTSDAGVFPLAAWRLGLRRARGSIAKG